MDDNNTIRRADSPGSEPTDGDNLPQLPKIPDLPQLPELPADSTGAAPSDGGDQPAQSGAEEDAFLPEEDSAPQAEGEFLSGNHFIPDSLPYRSYYSHREQPPLTTPTKRRRAPIVLLLVFLLIAAGVSIWLISGLHIRVSSTDQGTSLIISRQSTPVPDLEELFSETQEAPQNELASAQTGTGATLHIADIGADRQTLGFPEIYKKVIPSVVSISCVSSSSSSSSGTGIIMSSDGYIITNCHVIQGSYEITVLTDGEESYSAALVGSDEASDLAVLKIEAENLTPAEFGDSDRLVVGEAVLAIGDPLGAELRGTMTDGIVSAINRDILIGDRSLTLIQTNAALNSGNSGGPLINCYGQVIGVNTVKLQSYYTTVEGLGFAIPIASAKPIIDELVEKGYVSGRPALGIVGGEIPEYVAAYYNIPGGIYIKSVDASSDAARQGLQPGDIITAVEGTAVSSLEDLNLIKNSLVAGDTLHLTIYRAGETFDIGVVLMDAAQVT